ncbi:MAG TPA: two-component regulator propeller domain-containing protein [Anaerolineales bacterium]|nr:two-component regulator propeller domain-containing protein [Anaerolineales bacterium]
MKHRKSLLILFLLLALTACTQPTAAPSATPLPPTHTQPAPSDTVTPIPLTATTTLPYMSVNSDGSFFLEGHLWKLLEDPPIESWVTEIAIAPDGTLWLGTGRDGVLHYDGANWRVYNKQNGLPDDAITDVLVTSAGIVWVATMDSGVVRFDGESWVRYTTEDGLAGNNTTVLAATADGAIWVGTKYGGISRFDGASWISYTDQFSLATDYITAILETSDGVLWVGTTRCLYRFDGTEWVTFNSEDMGFTIRGEHQAVRDLCLSSDGALWVAVYEHGVARYYQGDWQAYRIDVSQTNWILNIAIDQDNDLWAGSFRFGFFRFDGKTWTVEDVPFQIVWDTATDPNGDLWFVTDVGVHHVLP